MSWPQFPGKKTRAFSFQSNLLTRNDQHALMDIMSIAFYVILFALAFMIARIIMRIMRGY